MALTQSWPWGRKTPILRIPLPGRAAPCCRRRELPGKCAAECSAEVPVSVVRTIENWRERGNCRFEDPELFFPLGESGPSTRQLEQARAVCHRCPVLRGCRAWAFAQQRVRRCVGWHDRRGAPRRGAAQVRGPRPVEPAAPRRRAVAVPPEID
ncbi:WhiB family transcriptional regulator [Streptomyces sp. NPDC020792]|uniref:WhiB family transcriptional regulator n=1 Tax=Streptomyces sp. NPDC020792 TaxID=3365089 RepID=UPI003794051A